MTTKEKFITDDKGKPLSVILDIKEYRKMQTRIDELEDIVLYDKSTKSRDEVIPFEQAIAEIEINRKLK